MGPTPGWAGAEGFAWGQVLLHWQEKALEEMLPH